MKTKVKIERALRKVHDLEEEVIEQLSMIHDLIHFANQVDFPETKLMLEWKNDLLKQCPELKERVVAAEQLGFNVMLKADASGVRAMYVKKPILPVCAQ